MTVACGKSDIGITTAVKAKLAADDEVKAYQIDVDTRDKVVTLSGSVDTEMAKTRALELARLTDGVSRVSNNLTVRDTTASMPRASPIRSASLSRIRRSPPLSKASSSRIRW